MQIPKIFFTYWEGNQLSKLHYYTILSFLKLNPSYSIIIYTSEIISNKFVVWNAAPHAIEINNVITLDEILNIDKERIKLININFENEYNISSNLSIVYKADFIRIAKLYEHGGLWFDFDIFFIKPIPDFLFESDIDIYYFKYYNTIPTGLLLSSPKNKILKTLFETSLQKVRNENSNEYQFIGPDLWNNIFNNNQDLLNSSVCLETEIIYPYTFVNYSNFYYNNDKNFIKDNTIGIHWFNGGLYTKNYINNFNENNINPENSIFEKYLFYIINL